LFSPSAWLLQFSASRPSITAWQPAEQAGRTAARLLRRQGGLAAATHPAAQGRRLPRCSAHPRASTPAAGAPRCQRTGPAAAVSAAGRPRGLQSPAGAGMTRCISSTRAQLPCRELTAARRCCRATQHTAHLHRQDSGGSARRQGHQRPAGLSALDRAACPQRAAGELACWCIGARTHASRPERQG